jgi:alpha-beta hydrolase superfamily lysophospholipase
MNPPASRAANNFGGSDPLRFYLIAVKLFRVVPILLLLCACGCGNFAARRMLQAPNTYPQWLAPKVPVTLQFSNKILAAFTNQNLEISSPPARIRYRTIPPADYQFRWTNRVDPANGHLDLSFSANIARLSERTNQWTAHPRGTVVLLHGYGDSGLAMLPWAFILAQEGWRAVLVDLRGHGQSTGKQIYFGIQEVPDLRALLDQLQQEHALASPVSVVGHSFGAVLALRWSMTDPRVQKVVAMAPYADLSRAIMSITDQYARWLPNSFLRAGLRKLPEFLHVKPDELNPSSWMEQNQHRTLFVAGGADKIVTSDEVQRLYHLAGEGNELLVIPNAAHEPLPFYLDKLSEPVLRWLSGDKAAETSMTKLCPF